MFNLTNFSGITIARQSVFPVGAFNGITIAQESIFPVGAFNGVTILQENNLVVCFVDQNDEPVEAEGIINNLTDANDEFTNGAINYTSNEHSFLVLNNSSIRITAIASGFETKIEEFTVDATEGVITKIKVVLFKIEKCQFSENGFTFLNRVKLPEIEVVDKGFKECCYTNRVLASETSSKYEENDFTGFFFKKQTISDSCDFILLDVINDDEIEITDDSFGVLKRFNSIDENLNLTTFIVEWKKVLISLGVGQYRVIKDITIGGIELRVESNTFSLEAFNQSLAENTVRIDCTMNGELVEEGVNFYNSGFTTSLRFKGFFGNRNPKYTQDNLLKRDYSKEQITMSQENEYVLESNLLPECITEQVYDFILFGDRILINDYNGNNHSYKYSKFEVELSGNKGAKYYPSIRDSKINLTFKDRFENKRKINCK